MEITSCGSDRFGDVLDLWKRSGAEATATDDFDALAVLARQDRDALRICTELDSVVGTLITTFDGWRGGFYRLAVLPSYRRRGVATNLVRDGEARLVRLGARRIALIVVDGHADAAAFWASIGYVHQTQNLRYVKDIATSS